MTAMDHETRYLNTIADFQALAGQRLGTSQWHTITQPRIAAFADATEDFAQIHLDPARAREAGFDSTIAHGLFTLSLGPKFLGPMYQIEQYSRALNYGFERVRFTATVPVGARVRMTADLLAAEDIPGGAKFTIRQVCEREGHEKPVCVADAVVAYFD